MIFKKLYFFLKIINYYKLLNKVDLTDVYYLYIDFVLFNSIHINCN